MTQNPKPLRPRATPQLEFPLELHRIQNPSRSGPLHNQLTEQLRQSILSGKLPAGTVLPSSRSLAQNLGISRNGVVLAFEELIAEGYLVGKRGSSTRVSSEAFHPVSQPVSPASDRSRRWLAKPMPPRFADPDAGEFDLEFRLGRPDPWGVSLEDWRKIWRSVLRNPPANDYLDPQGHLPLREVLSQYLGRSRGVSCSSEQMVITSGSIQSVDLLARAVLKPGDPVAIEEPCYRTAKGVLETMGAKLIPIPVDEDGLRVDLLPTGENAPLMLYCTPSHQYPLGSRLSMPRRAALLEWASQHDVLILEDDYDSEYRYDAAPLPALAGLSSLEQVAYLGTFSKVLSPALRLGYLVLPPALLEPILRQKRIVDFHSNQPTQQAMCEFVKSGMLEKHIWRMRRIYAHKREILREMLRPLLPWAKLGGLEAGLHAHLDLHPSLPASKVQHMLAQRGIGVRIMDSSYYISNTVPRNAVLLGYGGLELADLRRGIGVLLEVLEGMLHESGSRG
jgi:GntR family transcriptional regulator / MocR family aminotransferase